MDINTELETIRGQLDRIENTIADTRRKAINNERWTMDADRRIGQLESIADMNSLGDIKELRRIVLGDPDLGAMSVRASIVAMETTIRQGGYMIAGLVVSNLLMLIILLAILYNISAS